MVAHREINLISFQIERNIILPTIFLLIMNQTELYSVQNETNYQFEIKKSIYPRVGSHPPHVPIEIVRIPIRHRLRV